MKAELLWKCRHCAAIEVEILTGLPDDLSKEVEEAVASGISTHECDDSHIGVTDLQAIRKKP